MQRVNLQTSYTRMYASSCVMGYPIHTIDHSINAIPWQPVAWYIIVLMQASSTSVTEETQEILARVAELQQDKWTLEEKVSEGWIVMDLS